MELSRLSQRTDARAAALSRWGKLFRGTHFELSYRPKQKEHEITIFFPRSEQTKAGWLAPLPGRAEQQSAMMARALLQTLPAETRRALLSEELEDEETPFKHEHRNKRMHNSQ